MSSQAFSSSQKTKMNNQKQNKPLSCLVTSVTKELPAGDWKRRSEGVFHSVCKWANRQCSGYGFNKECRGFLSGLPAPVWRTLDTPLITIRDRKAPDKGIVYAGYMANMALTDLICSIKWTSPVFKRRHIAITRPSKEVVGQKCHKTSTICALCSHPTEQDVVFHPKEPPLCMYWESESPLMV